MSTVITAGNATNGLSFTADNTGSFDFKTGTGAGTTAMTIDASQNVAIPGALAVTGAQTIGGNLTVTGNVSGAIKSGTAVTASGTSIDFTSIPTGVKRITVMFSGVSTNYTGSSNLIIQLGDSGGVETTGYSGSGGYFVNAGASAVVNFTTGFGLILTTAATSLHGIVTICLLNNSNLWAASGTVGRSDGAAVSSVGGTKTLSDTLTQVRITTVNGTDTFDAGSINILYE